jgi:hypothetical protein
VVAKYVGRQYHLGLSIVHFMENLVIGTVLHDRQHEVGGTVREFLLLESVVACVEHVLNCQPAL